MTAPALDGTTARRLSAPVARISHDALYRNAVAALAGTTGPSVADLRRDAYGHGLIDVARTVLAAGVDEILVDADAALDTVRARTRTVGDATIDVDRLFGLPSPGATSAAPVMSLSGNVVSTKALRRGEGVSYGYTYRAEADTRIALVTGGYAQGIARSLGNRVDVLVDGAPHPIIGRVAMDVCVIDIGDAIVHAGDEAVYFGRPGAPPLDRWESASGLRAQELVTMIGLRAVREQIR